MCAVLMASLFAPKPLHPYTFLTLCRYTTICVEIAEWQATQSGRRKQGTNVDLSPLLRNPIQTVFRFLNSYDLKIIAQVVHFVIV